MSQEMASHLGDDSRAKTYDCFGRQTLDVSASILDFVKNAFDPLADAVEPAIQAVGILIMLIGASGCPDQIVGLIEDFGFAIPGP